MALAVAPLDAQGHGQGAPTAIAGTFVELEDLVVTVAWSDAVAIDWFEVAVLDENDLQVAGQHVWPNPGEEMKTTFAGFLRDVLARGFQYAAVVRDATGRDVLEPHAFRVALACPDPLAPCQWSTLDGFYTNALTTSERLVAALDVQRARGSTDLLGDVLEAQPDLRGPVLTLAAQLDQLDQAVGLGSACFCTWEVYLSHWPPAPDYEHRGSGPLVDGSGNEQLEIDGAGASVFVAGQTCLDPNFYGATASGTSGQTMEIVCWKAQSWVDKMPLPLLPPPGLLPPTIQFPKMEACPDTCLGSVESWAEFNYELAYRLDKLSSDPGLLAYASINGVFLRDDKISDPPKEDARNEALQWSLPGSSLEGEKIGSFRIPEGTSSFATHDIRSLTTELEATASIGVRGADAWSYATARLSDFQLQATANAACTVFREREAELTRPEDESQVSVPTGEELIEPWEYCL